jgi:nucleotide-binding universal stress UspA family protein
MTRFQTVLVATDGTNDSDGAVEAALDLAHDTGARLLVLTVVPEGTTVEGERDDDGEGRGSSPRADDEEITEAQERTDSVLDHAAEWGLDAHSIIWEGDPGETIVAAAEAEGADLIVVGTSGRGGVGRMLMGSTSDWVIRNATVPVLVVRTKRDIERDRE